MVRGLFSSLEFQYVQFPCTAISGDLLFDPLWQAIECIERCGLKVLAVTADGASPNCRLFKIHSPSHGSFTHKVPNPYSTDGRDLLFFSDPPHLLKTVRNCFASKSRALWVSFVNPNLKGTCHSHNCLYCFIHSAREVRSNGSILLISITMEMVNRQMLQGYLV